MSKLVDDAVRLFRQLPEDAQAAAAHAIIEYGACYDEDVGAGRGPAASPASGPALTSILRVPQTLAPAACGAGSIGETGKKRSMPAPGCWSAIS
jgi:hypothetical protein